MEIATGAAANVASGVVTSMLRKIKRGISYIFHYKKRVENFEKEVDRLKERRDRVQRKVDVAERNVEEIHSDVNNWLIEANRLIDEEAKEVKDLGGKANSKCFIGLCPNFKCRYQLSKKAEQDVSVVDELLKQGVFDEVSYRDVLPRTIVDAPPKDFEDFDSRKQVCDEIVKAVKDPTINVIGVYGMAGVGKTTLVKEVVRQVQGDNSFDWVVMAAVTQTPDIQKIQDQVAESLGLKLEEKCVDVRAVRLRERLKKEKKILVVLDDVWKRLDLKEVGIPFRDEHKGCTLLLSSRDAHVLSNEMDAEKTFAIDILKPEEALEFFEKMAANSLESPELQSIATQIAEKCAGLPIAISAIARALRKKESFQWKSAVCELQRPSPSNFTGVAAAAYSAIKVSYDQLESEEVKQTFLLCSLLGHNALLQDLLKYAMGLGLFDGVSTVEDTRNRLLTVVSHLKASCLLLDSYNKSHFDMHDLVRDVANSIAAKDNPVFALNDGDVLDDWPSEEKMGGWDRICLRGASITGKLPDQLDCPKLTFFYMFNKDPSMEIPTTFFEKMKNLKVLDLTRLNFTSLPSSIGQLANLRTLCLDQCVLGDISIIGELKNLEILSLFMSDIEVLPEEIGRLTKLKLLDLSRCTKLKIIPQGVLSSLSRLEELYIGNSFVQWEAAEGQLRNASLAEFKAFSARLTALEVHIPNAKSIPEDFLFNKLQRYKIFIGAAWDWVGRRQIQEQRTLKLELHSSLRHLNTGLKLLLSKAENVHLDERAGVMILLHGFEDWKLFRQFKNLHIQNGAKLKYIIKDDDVIGKIEFPQLQSLTLQDLPNLICFCSRDIGSTSNSPPELPFFNEKIMFPKLEKLILSSINIERIWHYQLPKGSTFSMQNLKSLIVEGCGKLKHILSHSMVKCLEQLEVFEIINCWRIQEIIAIDQEMSGDVNKATFSFPRLKTLRIEECPQLKGFITAGSTTEVVLFNEKVNFPELEKMTISHLRSLKRIWHDQLFVDSFCKMKELKVEYCDELLNVFPSFLLESFQCLEILTITSCDLLEEVFRIRDTCVGPMQLKSLYLSSLQKLKHVWNKDPCGNTSPFQNLNYIAIQQCQSLKSVFPFSIAKGLQQLESLYINSCGVEEIVSKNSEALAQQETALFEFNQLSSLTLWNLPNLKCFYPGLMHTIDWAAVKRLKLNRCEKIVYGKPDFQIQQPLICIDKVITQLEEVWFSMDDVASICEGSCTDFFSNIKVLGINFYFNESVAFPIHFLQRFSKLDFLVLGSYALPKLSSPNGEEEATLTALPKIKKLKLDFASQIRHLWKEDSLLDNLFASLETLEILNCHSLISLASLSSASFRSLTTLDVCKCNLMSKLFTPSNVQNLVHLVTMRITECGVMKEVVASEGDDDEATYEEIIFRELKCLELRGLPSLESFCPEKYTFKFPSLGRVIVSQCPSLKTFCQGDIRTSKLQRVQLKESDFEGRWAGDLNATVKQLHEEKVGYSGLKHLKFSEIPELEDIWNRNPQEVVEFKNLEFLEVSNSNNLKCVFNLNMASSLCRLQQLEIRKCNNLEAVVINEEEATTTTDDKSIIFPLLYSIIIEACPDMISFYRGSLSLIEFPSLSKIEISHCPNMISFVSTSPRDKNKQAIIGDGSEGNNKNDLTTLFCHKVGFPKLETLKVTDCGSLEEVFGMEDTSFIVVMQLRNLYLYRLPKLKRVWNEDPHGNITFEHLQDIEVKECWSLKSVFPFSIAKGLQQLQNLSIASCGVEEIVSKNSEALAQQETALFEFTRLSSLELWNLPDLKYFYPGLMHTKDWAALKRLRLCRCEKIVYGKPESQIQQPLICIDKVITQLEEVWFSMDDVASICEGSCRGFFSNIKVLGIQFDNIESAALPIHFLQRFSNLDFLVLGSYALTELPSSNGDEEATLTVLPKIKKLKLDCASRIRHLWKEDSLLDNLFASLETLEILNCRSLINLVSLSSASFQNLTTLDIKKCKLMSKLFTPSNVQNLVHLVTMRITECGVMKEVVASEGDDDEATYEEIIFRELKCLELRGLPSLESFCSEKYTFKFPSLGRVIVSQCPSLKIFCRGDLRTLKLQRVQLKESDFEGRWAGDLNATVKQLHEEKVGYSGLKHLKFSEIPELEDIWNRNPQEVVEFKNLEFLEVYNSNNLKCIFNLNMASSLCRLQQLEIRKCNNLEAVLINEEEAIATTIDDKSVIFPLLNSITIEACPDLRSFYQGSLFLIEFLSLSTIEISHCPNMITFVDKDDGTEGNNKNDLTALFCHKVGFPKLETLKVTDCGSLEEVFGMEDTSFIVVMQLRNLKLRYLPKLKRIWNEDPHRSITFENLENIMVEECWSLKSVFPFSIAKGLQRLQSLDIASCGVEEIVSKNSEGLEHETLFEFNRLSILQLWDLPDLKYFYPKMHTTAWPVLKKLWTRGCKKIMIFGDIQSQIQRPLFLIHELIPQLKDVSFNSDDIAMICECDGQFAVDSFGHIKTLLLSAYLNESAVLPFGFLQRFYNLEWLGVYDYNFKELSHSEGYGNSGEKQIWTLPKVRHLRLSRLYKIERLWNEDSLLGHICANLEALDVFICGSLNSLGSSSASFQNLTTLDVWKCNGMVELITASKAQSLVRLVTLKIRECEMMTEIVAREEDDEATNEITFRKLKNLELHCLQSLRSFCSGNHTFSFPSLEKVIVRQCANLKSFSQGALSTPRLRTVQLKETDFTGHWAGDLNASIEKIAQLSE